MLWKIPIRIHAKYRSDQSLKYDSFYNYATISKLKFGNENLGKGTKKKKKTSIIVIAIALGILIMYHLKFLVIVLWI